MQGAISCVDCAVGFNQVASGQESCTSCVPGRYTASTGSTICSAWYVTMWLLVAPVAPPFFAFLAFCYALAVRTGMLQSPADLQHDFLTSLAVVFHVPPLRVSAAGRYQASYSAYECLDCPPGKHGHMTGLASCFTCPENYRAAKHRSISCQRCQSPYTTMHRGAANCSACIARFYLHTGTMKCEKCDDEMSRCVATNGTTLATIDVKEGHYRFSKSSRVIYPCPNLGNCQGGV